MKPIHIFVAIIAVSFALSGILTGVFFTEVPSSSTGLVIREPSNSQEEFPLNQSDQNESEANPMDSEPQS